MTRLALAAVLAFSTSAALAQAGPADLTAVRALYLAADYEGALRLLATTTADDDVTQVEEYRALCLLALNRRDEAERSVERIFATQPLYRVDRAEMPPRMVELVTHVRQRLHAVLARNLYGLARRNVEHREYAAAIAQLEEMLAIVDAAGPESELDDLRVLGEGFLSIARGQLAAASRTTNASPIGSAGLMTTEVYSDFLKLAEGQSLNARGQPTPADPDAPLVVRPDIYSDADRIQPPVPVQRDVPRWIPPDAAARQGTHRGRVALVVDQRGIVEVASIAESVHEAYDAALLEAARKWRYRPATRNGEAVRYRLETEVVLRPPAAPTESQAP